MFQCSLRRRFACIACNDSPTEDETIDDHDKQPSLENMVYIPAGEFVMGSPEGEGAFDEHPQHKVYLDAYYIDKDKKIPLVSLIKISFIKKV